MYSANYGFEAIDSILMGDVDEEVAFKEYDRRVGEGVQTWYDLISMFYKLRNLFTSFAVRKRYRERVVRILQGNLYLPETLQRAREMIQVMEESYVKISSDPQNLLKPGALIPARGLDPVDRKA